MMKIVTQNKRAWFDYEILERFEAGISLLGSEIKSIREGHVHLKGSFISVRNGEAFWKGGYVRHWQYASQELPDELRDRRLLLKKREILALEKALNEKGNTVVPLALKLKHGKAKLDLALARGKKQYDKRETIKKRDMERQIAQGLRNRQRS